MTTRRQVAALPLRRAGNGALEVLLVTSRQTGRWIVPKGWTSKRLVDYRAAAREAKQEAGVKGKIGRQAIGSYQYVKPELGEATSIDVTVYLLAVSKQCKRWPEKCQRRRAWFGVLDAAGKIQEPELSALIGSLQQIGVQIEPPARHWPPYSRFRPSSPQGMAIEEHNHAVYNPKRSARSEGHPSPNSILPNKESKKRKR